MARNAWIWLPATIFRGNPRIGPDSLRRLVRCQRSREEAGKGVAERSGTPRRRDDGKRVLLDARLGADDYGHPDDEHLLENRDRQKVSSGQGRIVQTPARNRETHRQCRRNE